MPSQVPIWEPSGEQTDRPGVVQPPDDVLLPAAGIGAGAETWLGAEAGSGAAAGAGAGVTTGAAGDAGAGVLVGATGTMTMVDSWKVPSSLLGAAGEAPDPEFPPAGFGGAATAFWHTGGVSADVPAFSTDSPGSGNCTSSLDTVVHPLPMLATNISGRVEARLEVWPRG